MSSCKLCHGPLAPSASIKKPLECHATCIQFACPGCVKANKPSFSIINLNNHIYDYQCAECTAQTPTVSLVTHTKVGPANATTTIC